MDEKIVKLYDLKKKSTYEVYVRKLEEIIIDINKEKKKYEFYDKPCIDNDFDYFSNRTKLMELNNLSFAIELSLNFVKRKSFRKDDYFYFVYKKSCNHISKIEYAKSLLLSGLEINDNEFSDFVVEHLNEEIIKKLKTDNNIIGFEDFSEKEPYNDCFI